MRTNWAALLISLAASFVVESAMTIFTDIFPGPDRGYGAPLQVGESPGLVGSFMSLGGEQATFSPIVFAVNVLVTAVPLLLFARRAGAWGSAFAGLGMALFVAEAIVSVLFINRGVAFAGFPLPIATPSDQRVNLLAFWVDGVIGATLIGGLLSVVTARRSARTGPAR